MKVMTIASTKGGIGKSTCVNIAADRILETGTPVHLLDLDPQDDQFAFFNNAKEAYPHLSITRFADLGVGSEYKDAQAAAFGVIDSMADKEGILIIDVQGSESNLLQMALGSADLILVPMLDSPKELKGTMDTIMSLAQTERLYRRKLNVHFFWNEVSGIGFSKLAMNAQDTLLEKNFSLLGQNLMKRSAYKNIGENGRIAEKREDHYLKTLEEANAWVRRISEVI